MPATYSSPATFIDSLCAELQNSTAFQINARVESIEDKPTYKQMKENRCAIICNGFYEWDKEKRKYYISTKDEFIYLACIFNDKNELLILTKASEGEFSLIHSRCPVIMNQAEMLKYIHHEKGTIEKKNLLFERKENTIALF